MATNEPSRSTAGGGVSGHVPNMQSHRMRRMAQRGLGEVGAVQREADRLFDAREADFQAPQRHVVTIADITKGLGFDNADELRLWKAVERANPAWDGRSNQRLIHARAQLIDVLKAQKADSDVRQEVLRRADAWWRREHMVDHERAPHLRYTVEKSMLKAGPYYGPRGGRFADAKMTVPWRDEKHHPDRHQGHVRGALAVIPFDRFASTQAVVAKLERQGGTLAFAIHALGDLKSKGMLQGYLPKSSVEWSDALSRGGAKNWRIGLTDKGRKAASSHLQPEPVVEPTPPPEEPEGEPVDPAGGQELVIPAEPQAHTETAHVGPPDADNLQRSMRLVVPRG